MRRYLKYIGAIFIIFLASILEAKINAPYSYSYLPKFVYKNQVFPVTIYIKHFNPKDPPHFEFDIIGDLQPLDSKPTKLINKNKAFYTFYFKAKGSLDSNTITIPQLSIWNLDHTYMLQPQSIKVKKLDSKRVKNFSNLLASSLRVNSVSINPYDADNSLVTIKLEATEANIRDLKIPNVSDDGIENIKRDGARVTASYYFIVPSSTKSVEFSYYNLIKNRFENVKISTSIKHGFTQNIELTPKDLTFDKIKKYILIGLIVILFILIIITKDWLYVIIFIALVGALIYLYMPKKDICIKEGASIYILPTQNSNTSRQLDRKIYTSVIKKYKNFNKIEYKNIIGWVKDEDICKN